MSWVIIEGGCAKLFPLIFMEIKAEWMAARVREKRWNLSLLWIQRVLTTAGTVFTFLYKINSFRWISL